jgi:hypothetical protein
VAPPADYFVDALPFSGVGPTTGPSLDGSATSWVWQRSHGLRIGGRTYQRGVTMRAPAHATVQLNRQCQEFDAVAGIDDMALGLGAARFAVVDAATGQTLWSSDVVHGGDAAVPVSVPLQGVTAIRLVVREAGGGLFGGSVADWADARFSCR